MQDMFNVRDKVVVITGGTGVLGSEMARGAWPLMGGPN